MDLTNISKLSFLFSGAWPAVFAFTLGLTLLIVFQLTKKFRNFFGLAFIALPGCTLAVFGILGIVYASVEINDSVSQINTNSKQIIKNYEIDLVQKIKNGFYIEASNTLEWLCSK